MEPAFSRGVWDEVGTWVFTDNFIDFRSKNALILEDLPETRKLRREAESPEFFVQ